MNYQNYLEYRKPIQIIKLISYTLFLVFCLFGSQIFAGVLLGEKLDPLDPSSIAQVFYYSVYLEPIFILLAILCIYFLRKHDYSKAYGNRLPLKNLIKVVLISVAVIFIVNYLISLFFPTVPENQQLLELIFSQDSKQVWFFLSVVVYAPVMEELFFRKWIIGFLGHFNLVTVLISALLFTLVHEFSNIESAIPYFLLGLVISFSYYYSRDFRVPVIIHCINNLVAFMALYLA